MERKRHSETDFTVDLKAIEVPVLFIHGNDDRIVPIADAAALAVKPVRNADLKSTEELCVDRARR
ncbi:MAG TPA: alpha/beta hydrolase [Candidatus Acidoferrales bacterium]|nr:alpha/beta hydrolase [Candidatus Acidoferrales bacterium]